MHIAIDSFDSATDVALETADRVLATAEGAIAERGCFRILLAGGTTPLATYRHLATQPADWARWEIYYGDERCLAPDDPERNSRAARVAWLDHISIPPEQDHRIPAELGPDAGAIAYTQMLNGALPFDVVLLGMGEDGHTASLFPGHTIDDTALVVGVRDAPKPPPERITLTPKALAAARSMLVLVTGAGKRAALAAWRAGADLPIARVAALAPARVLADAAAIGV